MSDYKTSIPAFEYTFATKKEKATTSYEYLQKIEELMEDALNNLSPDAFRQLKENVGFMLDDFEE